MRICTIPPKDRWEFLDLLLLADDQLDLIEQYIDLGEAYAFYDPELVGFCIMTEAAEGCIELRSLAVYPEYQRRGYGTAILAYLTTTYLKSHREMIVATGDSPITVPFYEANGFSIYKRLKNYILEAYDHPILENGVQLFDMVYLRKPLSFLTPDE